MRRLLVIAALPLILTACSGPADDAGPTAVSTVAATNPSAAATGFAVTSADFADGDELDDWATASAYGGQCTGDNINPQLDWSGAPNGTVAFAVTLIDTSANNYTHWVAFDIAGDIDGIARGGSDSEGIVQGATSEATPGYFGPCPPDGDHEYTFTVYALDAPLGLEAGANYVDVSAAIAEHSLASATITGTRSGPANN